MTSDSPPLKSAAGEASCHGVIQVGREFGDYLLLEEIARGTRGVLFKAKHRGLQRVVALKIMLPEYATSDSTLQRFYVEMGVAARLAHPGIVTVEDFGQINRHLYVCMPLIEGESLSSRVSRKGIWLNDVVAIIGTAGRAVHHAHTLGVVHHNLKPSKILLGKDGRTRVAGFGVARRSVCGTTIKAAGNQLGPLSFLSPEEIQRQTDQIGPVSDVYSLGAVLYYALTGQPPFDGEDEPAILRDEPVPPTAINPTVPPGLEAICLKCLQKRPVDRYATASRLVADLSAQSPEVRNEEPTPAHSASPTQAAPIADATDEDSSVDFGLVPVFSSPKPTPWMLVVIVAVCVALACLGWSIWRGF